jgi:hypothetical protein
LLSLEYFSILNIIPVKVYTDLTMPENFKTEVHRIGGVYGLINISDPNKIKQYKI